MLKQGQRSSKTRAKRKAADQLRSYCGSDRLGLRVTTHLVPERAVRHGDRWIPPLSRTAKLRASGPARGVQDTAQQPKSESET